MTEIQNPESLIQLADEPLDDSVELPKDIETAEDFIAWSRRLDTHPHTRDQIQAELDRIGLDSEGCLNSDLATASRTFFKGTDAVEVIDWLEMAFK